MGRPIKYPSSVFAGAKFGRLEVLGIPFRAALSRESTWVCVVRCECGAPARPIQVSSLTAGYTKSCGCLRREQTGAMARRHAGTGEMLYAVWSEMKRRCRDARRKSFKHYGGRGISVDPSWATYGTFRDWAISNGYHEGLEIDRRDNDGPYAPENCRWVDRKMNMRNTRWNAILEAFGERKTMSEWAEDGRCLVGYSTLRDRISRGWDHQSAIGQPRRSMDGSLR